MDASSPVPVANTDRSTPYTVVTAIAAVFNMLILGVLCFIVMPRMEVAITESERNREAIRANHDLLHENMRELEEYRSSLRRFNALLDAAEAKTKKALKDNK